MDFTEFSAGADDDGRRLDRIIRRFIATEQLSGIYKAIRKGLVKVNGKKSSAEQHIHEKDIITIASFLLKQEDSAPFLQEDSGTAEAAPYTFPYEILFHNEHILIINKPYGKTVHGAADSIEKDVVKFYRTSFPERNSLSFTPGPLHRLDGRTTGILAFSWSLAGARWFSGAIASHAIQKTYLGIAQGHLEKAECWRDFISRNEPDEKRTGAFHTVSARNERQSAQEKAFFSVLSPDAAASVLPQEKLAVTNAFPVQYGSYKGKPVTLVKYVIETGRTHQIRSQSALHGVPLAGDTSYGGFPLPGNQKLFLHAISLSLPTDNPVGLPPEITAPVPPEFKTFLSSSDCETGLLRL